jgi:7-carboxy-7-deazaguanine synthase
VIHLNDLFHTVQGEGFHVGRRALFVRMPYCNLACSWCDTSFNSHKEWTVQQIVDFARKESTRFAVITGGEPTMHKHTPRVIEILTAMGFYVAIETNGHFPIPNGVAWVCCSPKKESGKDRAPYYVAPGVRHDVDEWKYVVDYGFDFSVLDRHLLCQAECPRSLFWLSPEHGTWRGSLDLILDYVAKNPAWRLNLQQHKIIGVP